MTLTDAEQAAELLRLAGYAVHRSRRQRTSGRRSRLWIVGLRVCTSRQLIHIARGLMEAA